MAIFAVIADQANPRLATKIEELYPSDKSIKINEQAWLITTEKLTKAVSEELGIRAGEFGRVIVLRASSSGAGWQRKSVWEWLQLKSTDE